MDVRGRDSAPDKRGRMNLKLLCAMALGAALLLSSPAQAAKCTKDSDCSVGQVCSLGTCKARSSSSSLSSGSSTSGTLNAPRIAWGNIGYYNVGVGVDVPFFGTVTGTTGAFGINVGTAVNVMQLSPDVPLAVWGNAAIAFPSGGTVFPLTAGAAVRYDKLPVGLLGGLGITLEPNSFNGAASSAPIGLAIQGMGFLPLPQVMQNLSADLGIGYHFLTSGFSLFTFTAGAAIAY